MNTQVTPQINKWPGLINELITECAVHLLSPGRTPSTLHELSPLILKCLESPTLIPFS